jgi:hypothetical protein
MGNHVLFLSISFSVTMPAAPIFVPHFGVPRPKFPGEKEKVSWSHDL